jgi:hypothetical protein
MFFLPSNSIVHIWLLGSFSGDFADVDATTHKAVEQTDFKR